MRSFRYIFLLAILGLAIIALCAANDAEARTCTWDGGGANALSSTPANWDTDTAPISNDVLVWDSGSAPCTFDLALNFNGFYMNASYTGVVTIAASTNFQVTNLTVISGTLTGVTSSVITVNGSVWQPSGAIISAKLCLNIIKDSAIIKTETTNSIYNLHISANVSSKSVVGLQIYSSLIVDAGKTFTIGTGYSVYWLRYGTTPVLTVNGLISGSGTFEIRCKGESLNPSLDNITTSTFNIRLMSNSAGNGVITLPSDASISQLTIISSHASYTMTVDANGHDIISAISIVVSTRSILSCGEGNIYTSSLTSTLGTVTPETATWHFTNNSLITMAAGGTLYDVEVNGTALRLGSDVVMNSLTFLGLTPSHPYGWYENAVRQSSVASDANGSYALGADTFAWDSATLKITPVVTVYDNYEWTHDDGTDATNTYVDYHYWLMFVSDYELGTTWTLTGADWLLLYDDGMIAGRSSIPGNFSYTINVTGSNGEVGSFTGYILVHEFLPDPDWPDNPGAGVTIDTPVLFILGDVEVTLWDMYDPYYIEVTNDTLNIATVAGEFPMTYWSDGSVDVNVTTFKPYTNTFFVASLSSSGDDLDLRFGGFQPGATFTVVIGGVSSIETADGAGYLIINVENIISTTLSISYLHTPPVFTTSPDIVANEMVWYVYDADVYPSDAVVTIEEKPYWLYWDEDSYSLIGYPRDLGTFEVRLKATNSYGTSWQNWTIYIYSHEIGFTSNPDLTIDKFDYYEYEVDYYPPSAVCKVLLIPTWLHFNEYTDTLKGTALKAGSYNVVIRVTLGHAVAYQNFTITVNDVSDPSWLDHDMSIDAGTLLFYILIGGGVVFMMIVFYIKRM